MSVTITITDPTVQEANALRAYLTALHGSTSTPEIVHEKLQQTLAPLPGITDPMLGQEPEYVRGPTAEDAGAPDFDSAGLPHDPRIHASSRATISDGTWKKKRGVSAEEVAAVEAELRARITVHHADGSVTIPDTDAPPDLDHYEPGAQEAEAKLLATVVSAPEAPAPVQEQSAPDAPPAPPVDTPNPFLAVMSRIGKSGMTKEQKDELLTAAGALDDKGNPSILVLNKKPELIAGFVALLDDAGV